MTSEFSPFDSIPSPTSTLKVKNLTVSYSSKHFKCKYNVFLCVYLPTRDHSNIVVYLSLLKT